MTRGAKIKWKAPKDARARREIAHQRERIISGSRAEPVLGSDRRVAGGRLGRCKRCQRKSQLRLSHIVPRWAYDWMKSEGGVLGDYRSLGVMTSTQDGTKHYLLCDDCEQYLGDAENYLARLSRGTMPDLAAIGVRLRPGQRLDGVNPTLTLRGLVGIALKCHWASGPPFHRFRLPRDHRDLLLSACRTDRYGKAPLGVIGIKWLSVSFAGANPRALMFPSVSAIGGTSAVDVLMGGVSYGLMVGDPRTLPDDGKFFPFHALMNTCGCWQFLIADLREHRRFWINDRGPEIEAKPWLGLDADAPCPCGIGDTRFGECCRDTWCADQGSRVPMHVVRHRLARPELWTPGLPKDDHARRRAEFWDSS